ncbi:peptidase A1 domain-containing protein [Favolaschia claudopus]|uniref:Peptidase A1 domain-containing protein n=1 Tax=Favolaschia claudopus TaxID=2862362 RepID=A0AAW0AFI0_9AGAR
MGPAARSLTSSASSARSRALADGNVVFTMSTDGTEDNEYDFRYSTNITINGRIFKVAIDTGSADLWISRPDDFTFNDTGIPVTNSYGVGAFTEVNGTIGFASVQLGKYTFDNQVFNAATSVGLPGILDQGLDGLMGFDFGLTTSNIKTAILKDGTLSTILGQPFVSNIFDLTPSRDNFLAISLSRTDDMEGSATASFLINEISSEYSDVVSAPSVALFPGSNANGRWSVPIDSISLDGVDIPFTPSTVPGAPQGKLIALMDTGTPSVSFPADFIDRLYAAVPGSVQVSSGNWNVPCNTTSIMSVQIGGQPFPIHPLDLSEVQPAPDGSVICQSVPFAADGTTVFDSLFGDTILRNIYSVYNFGAASAKTPSDQASMQFLAQTDPTAAKADVLNVRMAAISSGAMTKFAGAAAAEAPVSSPSPSGSSSSFTDKLNNNYGPIVIGLLAANLFVVLVLAVVALVMCVKRSRAGGATRTGRYVPVRVREEAIPPVRVGEFEHGDKPYSD